MRFTRYPWYRRWFGRRSERAAVQHLRTKRYTILATNLEDDRGEIDILALDGDMLVVVEVRSTQGTDIVRVMDTIDTAKQRKLTDAVTRFLKTRHMLGRIDVRFDIMILSWPAASKTPTIQHIENAFPAVGRFQMFH